MDLLRSRATSKTKMVICLSSTTKVVLYVLNLCRNRLLITFAGLPASVQRLNKLRTNSAIFRLQLCCMWFNMGISVKMPVLANKRSTSAPRIGKA